MDKNTKLKVTMKIEPEEGTQGLYFEGTVSMENMARICRMEMKHGGGCPVGNVLSCPFYYEPYMEKHAGERPISCRTVKAEDWIELYSIVNSNSEKKA